MDVLFKIVASILAVFSLWPGTTGERGSQMQQTQGAILAVAAVLFLVIVGAVAMTS